MEKKAHDLAHVEEALGGDKTVSSQNNNVDGDVLLVDQTGAVQKLPIPSSDPNDPLNYKAWEKAAIIFNCCWFSIMSLALAGGLGAILVTFFKLYSPAHTTNEIVWLTTFPSLFIGIGNLIILPLSMVFGRRPTFLISIFGLLLATIGAAVQNSYSGHLAARIIQGLTTGATESLLPLMITEITFVHQRSRAFGAYWATQTALSSALNLASSYETASLSWRWYYWVFVITIAFGFVTAIFGAFETKYQRSPVALRGTVIVTDQFGVTSELVGDDAVAFMENEQQSLNSTGHEMSRKSYLSKLSPVSGNAPHPFKVIATCWIRMAKALLSPGIVYAVLVSAAVLGCAVGVSLTYNTVLEENYNWPAANVGLINIGGVIGSFLGMMYAGWPADKFIIWAAKRNGGVHKPEHRLLLMPFVGLIGLAALILYGFTAEGATWWGPYIGWTLYEFCFVAILIITTTFAAECQPKDPGPALVMVVGAKNIIAFGLSYGLIPMLSELGYTKAIAGALSGIHAGIFLLGIPTYYLSPKYRHWAMNRT